MIKAGEELLRLQAENQRLKEGIKQARKEINNLKEYGAKFEDGFEIHVNKADVLEIIGNLIVESEG